MAKSGNANAQGDAIKGDLGRVRRRSKDIEHDLNSLAEAAAEWNMLAGGGRNRRNSKLYYARPQGRRRETCRARRPWMSSRTSAAAAPHAAEVSSEADGRVAAAEEIDAAAEAERPAET